MLQLDEKAIMTSRREFLSNAIRSFRSAGYTPSATKAMLLNYWNPRSTLSALQAGVESCFERPL
jgi:hypothetical protein